MNDSHEKVNDFTITLLLISLFFSYGCYTNFKQSTKHYVPELDKNGQSNVTYSTLPPPPPHALMK